MRVIAGDLRGRRLVSPAGDLVRPTPDRVREALFSILGDVSGLDVLDLFAGTGALGIEALSRGAASATLVDTDIGPATANVEALGLGDRAAQVRVDAVDFLAEGGRDFDLILCDPPYTLAARFEPDLRNLLAPRLRAEGRIAVESDAGAPIDLGHALVRERRYGSTLLRIWKPGAPEK